MQRRDGAFPMLEVLFARNACKAERYDTQAVGKYWREGSGLACWNINFQRILHIGPWLATQGDYSAEADQLSCVRLQLVHQHFQHTEKAAYSYHSCKLCTGNIASTESQDSEGLLYGWPTLRRWKRGGLTLTRNPSHAITGRLLQNI